MLPWSPHAQKGNCRAISWLIILIFIFVSIYLILIDSTDEKAKQFMHEHKGHEFRVSEDLRKKFNKRGYIIAEKSVWTLL